MCWKGQFHFHPQPWAGTASLDQFAPSPTNLGHLQGWGSFTRASVLHTHCKKIPSLYQPSFNLKPLPLVWSPPDLLKSSCPSILGHSTLPHLLEVYCWSLFVVWFQLCSVNTNRQDFTYLSGDCSVLSMFFLSI